MELSKPAGTGIGGVDAACRASRNDLHGYGSRFDGALIPQIVHVVTARIDKAHSGRVDGGFTVGIVSLVDRDGSLGDDDQAMPGVGVPAGAASGSPDVVLNVEVRQPLRPLE